jgi:hypothetical protein
MAKLEINLDDIEHFIDRVEQGSEAEAYCAYEFIGILRKVADGYERDLLRALKWDPVTGKKRRRWEDVAQVLGLENRQAVWSRWHLLTDHDRGKPRRGRPPGAAADD